MSFSDLPARLQFSLASATLAGALVLGGGQGFLGDGVVQMLALALVAVCLWRQASDPGSRLPRLAWMALLPLALPILQLLPLPEGVWLMPAARAELGQELAAAGVEPAGRWSLVPLATEQALFWVLPAVALFLACLQLDGNQRRKLLALLVLAATASVLLGLAQLADGRDSGLRFYSNTNIGASVGFFANRNHLASLLAVALPLVVVGSALWLERRESWDARTLLGVAARVGLVALLILGIAITLSRAGLLLGMLGLFLSLPVVLGLRRRRGTTRWLAVGTSLGLMLALQFALFGIVKSQEKDPLDDARLRYLPVVEAVARQHGPLGTGLGGFRRAFEAEDPAQGRAYINHAHNDWAELWLEGGWPGLALMFAAAAGLVVSGWRLWRQDRDASPGPRAIARAAWLGLLLLALHSLADYPLRTSALLAVAGLLAGQVAVVAGGREKAVLPLQDSRRRLGPAFNP